MMKFKLKFKLQTKIILLTVATAAGVLLAITYIDSYWAYQLDEDNRYDRYVGQARTLVRHIRDDNLLDNPEQLNQELRSLRSTAPGNVVLQIDVYARPDGTNKEGSSRLIATTAKNGPPLPDLDEVDPAKLPAEYSNYDNVGDGVYSVEQHPAKGPEAWVIGAQINNGDSVIGCVVLKGERILEYKYLDQLRLKTTLLVLGSIVSLLAVLLVVFWLFFRRPMRTLIATMSQAETGNLTVQAPVSGEDEFGILASTFNRMIAKISTASEENQTLLHQIKQFNEELSQKVLLATTELAEKNRELRHVNQLLFETQRTLATSERQALAGQMAASLAHEIGTPLNAISGHVQLISKSFARDERTQRRLKIIAAQIEQITATVKNLLAATRHVRMVMRPLEPNTLIQETLALTEPVLDARGIIVKTSLAENLPLILGDDDRLRQVLLNLTNNSIDAMPHGGRLMIKTEFEPEAGEAGRGEVVITISDTGCGIEPGDMDKIFEPMFTTKRIGEGVGLGLAICRETIEEHDGRITAWSTPQSGTTFMIRLPEQGAVSEGQWSKVDEQEEVGSGPGRL